MAKCKRDALPFPRCHFKPVFDVEPPTSVPAIDGTGTAAARYIDALSKKTFRGMFCVRCGIRGDVE